MAQFEARLQLIPDSELPAQYTQYRTGDNEVRHAFLRAYDPAGATFVTLHASVSYPWLREQISKVLFALEDSRRVNGIEGDAMGLDWGRTIRKIARAVAHNKLLAQAEEEGLNLVVPGLGTATVKAQQIAAHLVTGARRKDPVAIAKIRVIGEGARAGNEQDARALFLLAEANEMAKLKAGEIHDLVVAGDYYEPGADRAAELGAGTTPPQGQGVDRRGGRTTAPGTSRTYGSLSQNNPYKGKSHQNYPASAQAIAWEQQNQQQQANRQQQQQQRQQAQQQQQRQQQQQKQQAAAAKKKQEEDKRKAQREAELVRNKARAENERRQAEAERKTQQRLAQNAAENQRRMDAAAQREDDARYQQEQRDAAEQRKAELEMQRQQMQLELERQKMRMQMQQQQMQMEMQAQQMQPPPAAPQYAPQYAPPPAAYADGGEYVVIEEDQPEEVVDAGGGPVDFEDQLAREQAEVEALERSSEGVDPNDEISGGARFTPDEPLLKAWAQEVDLARKLGDNV